jgi:hypothetical protein
MITKIKLFTALLCIISLNIYAQSTDEIVNNHIKAIGGVENWQKVKSLKMENTLKSQGGEVKVTICQIDKKAVRQDISVMGMNGYSIVTNTEGWTYMPWGGQTKPEAMTADDVKNSQNDLYLQDEFITYKELNKKIESFGKDDVEGTECYKVKMTDKDGNETTFYLDASNYYVIKQTKKQTANGKEMEVSTTYSDYKKLPEGIVFPMSITSDWGEAQVTKLEINPQIDESVFKISQ